MCHMVFKRNACFLGSNQLHIASSYYLITLKRQSTERAVAITAFNVYPKWPCDPTSQAYRVTDSVWIIETVKLIYDSGQDHRTQRQTNI